MKPNRRNYYRILHVQPEAPAAVITASYRTLMGPLKQHPDRGGSHEAALLLNEAYAVLSDPERRRAYDLTLAKESLRRGGPAPAQDEEATASTGPSGRCAFCGSGAPPRARPGVGCLRCGAPLAAPPSPPASMRELFGKRGAQRYVRSRAVRITAAWGEPPHAAELIDLSLGGLAMSSPRPADPGQRMRVGAPEFDAVIEIVACQPKAGRYRLHARFLTFRAGAAKGAVFSTTA